MLNSLEIKTAEPAHVQLRKYYQQQIRTGVLQPGDALPSTQDMARQWGISCTAVQKALTQLSAAGLVERAQRRGTFVSSDLREIFIGILIGPSLADESMHFYRILAKTFGEEVSRLRSERNWNCRIYDNLTLPQGMSETKRKAFKINGHQAFFNDLRHYPFKGMIEIARDVDWWKEVPSDIVLPVAVSEMDVKRDYTTFYKDVLKYMLKRNRKKIAIVECVGPTQSSVQWTLEAFAIAESLGLPRPEILTLYVKGDPWDRQQMVHEQMLPLIRRWRSTNGAYQGPDGLIATDDLWMRSIALALLQENVRIPEELLVLCMTTEEIRHYYGIPVVRYDYSARQTAACLLDLLWQRLLGGKTSVKPVNMEGRIAIL